MSPWKNNSTHASADRSRASAHERFLAICIVATMLFVALFGCQKPAPTAAPTPKEPGGSCILDLAIDATDEEAIRAILNAEGETVVSQDIDRLMKLWSEDAKVSDAKYTPDDDSDNQYWQGKDAVRHRYVRTVFPGAPSAVQPSDLSIVISGERATVIGTTHIGDEVSPAGDRWELVRIDGCWYINSLTYNLEPTE